MLGSIRYALTFICFGAFLSTSHAESTSTDRCFGTIDAKTTFEMLTKKCGKPSREVGSGMRIPIWDLADGSRLSVSFAGLNEPIFNASLSKPNGDIERLYRRESNEHRISKSQNKNLR